MANSKIYSCPACKTANYSSIEDLSIVVCKTCQAIVYKKVEGYDDVPHSPMPQDWSFIRIGTQFQHNQASVEIVGRVRLQLRNEYKNFWCGTPGNGAHVWIMESFASFCLLAPQWHKYNGTFGDLHAGDKIRVTDSLELIGEYREKCEQLSFEGEVGTWKLVMPGFHFFQCSDIIGNTAVFTMNGSHIIYYLAGAKIDVEKLSLKNTLEWDEWK